MNKITCDICMDLIPLVKDGVASDDSIKAVKEHIEECETCRTMFQEDRPTTPNTEHAFIAFRKQLQLSSTILLMFGIFFGLSLTAGVDMFYNTIVMPITGAIGYLLFRKKACYIVPGLLFGTHCFMNLIHYLRGSEYLDFYSLLTWTFLYSAFSIIGSAIAALLYFAFRKEEHHV